MWELYLSHGRNDPDQDMSDWGFEGPRLARVIGLHETYRSTLSIIFADTVAADDAEAATGWTRTDSDRLEVAIHDDMIRCGTGGAGALSYFGDWGLIMPDTARHADGRRRVALARALRFVEGFEGDDTQEGVDGPNGLLAALRAAMSDDPAGVARRRDAKPFDPLSELDASLRGPFVEEMGMRPFGWGDGLFMLRHDGPNGWHILVSSLDGGAMPSAADWNVGLYAPGEAESCFNMNSRDDGRRFTVTAAVAGACGIISDLQP